MRKNFTFLSMRNLFFLCLFIFFVGLSIFVSTATVENKFANHNITSVILVAKLSTNVLDTKNSKLGDPVVFKIIEPQDFDKALLVGRIKEVKSAGKAKNGSKLVIQFEKNLQLFNRKAIRISLQSCKIPNHGELTTESSLSSRNNSSLNSNVIKVNLELAKGQEHTKTKQEPTLRTRTSKNKINKPSNQSSSDSQDTIIQSTDEDNGDLKNDTEGFENVLSIFSQEKDFKLSTDIEILLTVNIDNFTSRAKKSYPSETEDVKQADNVKQVEDTKQVKEDSYESIQCMFSYRSSVKKIIETERIVNLLRSKTNLEEGEFKISVENSPAQNSKNLIIIIRQKKNDGIISRLDYPYTSISNLKKSITSNYGFTGLHYAFIPGSQEELQYFCTVEKSKN